MSSRGRGVPGRRRRSQVTQAREKAMTGADPIAADALIISSRIQSEASAQGFDWPDIRGVLDKLAEELAELRKAWEQGQREQACRELGDLLLAAVNAARFLDTDPAHELHRANQRFSERFEAMKKILACEGRRLESCTLDELDAIWEQAKVRMNEQLEEPS